MENFLIFIDEIDKIGCGYQGDLLFVFFELFDFEQNSFFFDYYFDVLVDLFRVLFVCIVNMMDMIFRLLLDCMEVIRLSGYVFDEKMVIVERYFVFQVQELVGLKGVDVEFIKDVIEELIKFYCWEVGVCNFKKQIEKVYCKSVLKIVQEFGEEVLFEEEVLMDEGKVVKEELVKEEIE